MADSANLVDGRYSILDLVDIDQLRTIFEQFHKATGFTIGFLDHPGLNILISTGWRDICTKFHRQCPLAAEVCTRSNTRLLGSLSEPGQLLIEACEHGLVDCATPIIIKGKHIASLATGQLMFEPPDPDRFRRQARKFGFDEEAYLNALTEVPVISREKVLSHTAFLGSLAAVISEMGLAHLEIREKAARLEREISERRQAEENVRESEEKYRALVDTTGTGYVFLDERGLVRDANPEYIRMTGRASLAQIQGHSVAEWTAPHDLERNMEEVRKCMRLGSVKNLKIDYVGPTGEITPVEINATVLQKPQGSQIISLCRDITERKQAEAQRLEMEKNILQVQKLESLGLLAGGIAHDFNNLLTGILGNVELGLLKLPGMSPVREHFDGIRKAGRQAADLCRQMLAYSGRGKFVTKIFDLRDLIRDMMSMLEISISKKAVLTCHLDDPVPPIEADPSQIRQVLMNLVINASEAIGQRSGGISLTVGVKECRVADLEQNFVGESPRPGSYVSLEVADTGCGIDVATRKKIFQPFFSTKYAGRGLGLAAVMGIVRSHKGMIRLQSEPGTGSRFTILFPAASGAAEHLVGPQEGELAWKGSGTVLLADDEETVRVTSGRMLQHLGFEVIFASDGREAVEQFRKATGEGRAIACVILDLNMPFLDGYEVMREMKSRRADIPIILASGFHEQDVLQKCIGEKPCGFLQKPVQIKELATALKNALKS